MTVGPEVLWWKSLNEKDMLEMALVLSKKALPAWNNFHLHSQSKHELKSLPANALQDIEAILKGEPGNQKLNEHFTSFITPVIHIQDGYLKFPYEVKLAFLSVFHILHGMLSTTNMVAAQEAFCTAINKAIDAIKIAGILTAEEISVLTQKYYRLVQIGA